MHSSTWICIFGAVLQLLIAVGYIIYSIVKRNTDYLVLIIVLISFAIVVSGFAYFSEKVHSVLEVQCAECGNEFSIASKYCEKCGATNNQAPVECECSTKVDIDTKFCLNCGEEMDRGE